jgi:hypothetical protein
MPAEIEQRDGFGAREVRVVFRHGIGERQLALLGEHQRSAARELLGDRSDREHRAWRDRRFRREIADPVPLRENDFPALHHADREADDLSGRRAGDDAVDPGRSERLRLE